MDDITPIDWEQVPDKDRFKTILIGNGHSIAISPDFAYTSLLEKARFTGEIQGLFDQLNTTDFEIVLDSLHVARRVLDAIGQPVNEVNRVYEEIRNRLFDVVEEVHPEPLEPEVRREMYSELSKFGKIFTTNYDVILYWAAMMDHPRFVDFFNPFVKGNSSWNPANGLYFLHGALHIWHDPIEGVIEKHAQDCHRSLLQVIREDTRVDNGKQPLFVSEGTSSQKVRSIERSSYLDFALKQLRLDDESVIVFGSRLTENDDHIVSALGFRGDDSRRGIRRRIAISRHLESEDQTEGARWLALKQRLEEWGNKVIFFKSSGHPLADTAA
jgi:hypothetical protein